MATFFLGCLTSAISKLVARFGGRADNVIRLLRPLKWQAILIVLIVLSGQIQQAVMRGNLETASLWSGLAISELVMALSHYSADT